MNTIVVNILKNIVGNTPAVVLVYVVLSLYLSANGQKEAAEALARKWSILFDSAVAVAEAPHVVGSGGPPALDLDSLKREAEVLRAEQVP